MSRIPKEFKVEVPEERTAQYPAAERDASRLLLVDRERARVEDAGQFRRIADFIAGDLVVINETRVIPARVEGRRPGGGWVELLLLVPAAAITGRNVRVEALISPGGRLRGGMVLSLNGGAVYCLQEKDSDGRWTGWWTTDETGESFDVWLSKHGMMPLPPYIRRPAEQIDKLRYQTTYASQPGSLAAPTAGLHFTPELLAELERQGCDIARLTLDVGIGTFLPIRTDDLSSHHMHEERYLIPPAAADKINRAKASVRNITAVGTTVVRALEDAARHGLPLQPGERIADLFIHPPYQFRAIDRLLTNFHRPDSTLLQLVAAFIGWDLLNQAYQTALDRGFRFYSYGDAMVII